MTGGKSSFIRNGAHGDAGPRDAAERTVDELDFGRGNDPYKRLWMTQCRQRVGVVLADPRRPVGLAVLARRLLGHGLALLRAGG